MAESHRIKITTDDQGRSHLKLSPALSFDQGMYKVVARNKIGQTIARARIVLGMVPDEPDSPEASQVGEKTCQKRANFFPLGVRHRDPAYLEATQIRR